MHRCWVGPQSRRYRVLTRALLGGGCLNTPPCGFSRISQKRRRGAPPFLVHLIIHQFYTCCENFRPRSFKVRSPGHLKWPHLIKSFNVCHSYTEWPIALKLSAIAKSNSMYKMYISEFWYRWPKVRSILRPPHYKSMGENWNAPLLDERHYKHSQTLNYKWFRHTEHENGVRDPCLCPEVILGHEWYLTVFRK